MRVRLHPRVERLEDRCTPATFTVTSLADAGAGSLRAAIALAEADAVADTLVFDPTIRGGTINLTTFDTGLDPLEFGPSAFNITTPVTIQGTGETIRRDPTAAAFRLFAVLANGATVGQLTLSDLELAGGLARGGNGLRGGGGAGGFGGAIYTTQVVNLVRVTVAGNTAQGGNGGAASAVGLSGGGGGVGQSATTSNGGGPNGGTGFGVGTPNGGNGGGGVGAIASGAGAGGFGGGGGGVSATGFGAGGGFGGGGGGAPSGNNGLGGFGGANGANGAGGGGAGMGGGVFNNRGTVNVENGTFSGNAAVAGTGGTNTARALGGGVFNYNGTVVARSSTFTGNAADDGRQVFALGQFSGPANVATTDLTNSILGQADVLVADFVGQTSFSGTSTTAGSGNLIRTAVGFLGGVVSTADPLLAPLANNGGPTRTHLPRAGSPALDALAASAAGTLTTDQRGFARVSGGLLDIGAVEVQPPVIVPPLVVPVVPPTVPVASNYLVGAGPDVQVRAGDGTLLRTIPVFAPTFTGGLSVAYADVTGDGVRDIIAGAGQFGGQIVKVFDGVNAALLYEFLAFDHALCGGVSVAAADLNGDGVAEIVVGAGAGGGPHVKVFDVSAGQLRLVKSFYAFSPEFRGGVNVGAGGGLLVVAAGPGGAPHVKAFRGLTDELVASFYAFAASFNGGVSATAGDLNGDGVPEIVAGVGQFGGSQVAVFDPAAGKVTASFRVYDPSFNGGVAVALEDATGDGALDFVFGAGPGGGSHVLVRNGLTFSLFSSYYAVGEGFRGGLKVA